MPKSHGEDSAGRATTEHSPVGRLALMQVPGVLLQQLQGNIFESRRVGGR